MYLYQEITLLIQPDVHVNHVMSEVYQGIHNAICDAPAMFSLNVGVSFPLYEYDSKKDEGSIGNKIRLFAKDKRFLEQLKLTDVLGSYADYIHISSIKEVGDRATHYEIYSRYHRKSHENQAKRLQTHLTKKYGEEWFDANFGSYHAVLTHCKKNSPISNYPHIQLLSNSNGFHFNLTIKRDIVKNPAKDFKFTRFGLRQEDTVSSVPAW